MFNKVRGCGFIWTMTWSDTFLFVHGRTNSFFCRIWITNVLLHKFYCGSKMGLLTYMNNPNIVYICILFYLQMFPQVWRGKTAMHRFNSNNNNVCSGIWKKSALGGLTRLNTRHPPTHIYHLWLTCHFWFFHPRGTLKGIMTTIIYLWWIKVYRNIRYHMVYLSWVKLQAQPIKLYFNA